MTAVTTGTAMTIQGTVMDKSPGMLTAGGGGGNMNPLTSGNIPAISEDNMTVWMDYLYGQNATLINSPPQCNGVPVTLTAVGPDGSVTNIGTATSNYLGNYATSWTPTTAGLYTIYASFAGSSSYYGSEASTSVTVASTTNTATTAPTTTTIAATAVSNSDLLTYLIVGIIAIILAIAIATVLMLRKKP